MEAPLRSTQADRRPKRHDYSAFNVVNLKSSNQFSNYENQQKALSELASLKTTKHKILPLLLIKRKCKNCL